MKTHNCPSCGKPLAVDRIEWTKTDQGVHLLGSKGGQQVVDTTEKENVVSDAIGTSMVLPLVAASLL